MENNLPINPLHFMFDRFQNLMQNKEHIPVSTVIEIDTSAQENWWKVKVYSSYLAQDFASEFRAVKV